MKTSYGQVLSVDNGGFFPEEAAHQDTAWFLIDMMKTMGVDAVNIGERDLRYGRVFLEQRVKRSQLPVVSANLLDKRTGRPLFSPYIIKKVGNVNVGVFGLIADKAELGPGKDSLAQDEPLAAARRVVPEMRRKGAQVVVLLSQLGKVEGEDLVSAVDGIDAVMLGKNVFMIQRGRMVKNTIACYGGEQGQYACRTELTLDAKGHMTAGESEAVMLGPQVGEKPEILALVKGFEDAVNDRLRRAEMEHQVTQSTATADNNPSHYLGSELCIRCHREEGDQWKTTSHSQAWSTLVNVKKDAMAECITCHVLGFRKPGGYQSTSQTPNLVNVQCENCHGMGTEHDGFSAHPVTAEACIQCHHGENDPEFDFDKKLPMIIHTNSSGETIQRKKVKSPADAKSAPMNHGG